MRHPFILDRLAAGPAAVRAPRALAFAAPYASTRGAILLSALVLSGCGAAATPDLHAAFASIQVDEARIARASMELETAGDEALADDLVGEICDAAGHLGATAAPLHDRDADTRSARATATCEAAHTRAAR